MTINLFLLSFALMFIFWLLFAFFSRPKCRIIKTCDLNENIVYQVQEKHFFLRWQWVPAAVNHDMPFSSYTDIFNTRNAALEHAINTLGHNLLKIN
jgi:hypothetical protein